MELELYWHDPGWPLLRLLLGLSCGLLLATLLEAMGWIRKLARVSRPLCAAARLGPFAGSAFAMAFVSPATANALLAEGLEKRQISVRELYCANMLCGLPAYFAHMPGIFFLTFPVLGWAALGYAGVTFVAAVLRTGIIIAAARFLLLPHQPAESAAMTSSDPGGLRAALAKGARRFRKRLARLVFYTVPMYLAVYLATKCGFFGHIQDWLGRHLQWLTILDPEALGIVMLQMIAEMGATLGAAGAVLNDGLLTPHDVVVAMLVGNVMATPLRAVRHQLPAYAGFYKPALAVRLVAANQCLRAICMTIVIFFYVRIFL